MPGTKTLTIVLYDFTEETLPPGRIVVALVGEQGPAHNIGHPVALWREDEHEDGALWCVDPRPPGHWWDGYRRFAGAMQAAYESAVAIAGRLADGYAYTVTGRAKWPGTERVPGDPPTTPAIERCHETGEPIDTCNCYLHADETTLAIRRGELGPDGESDEGPFCQQCNTPLGIGATLCRDCEEARG